MCIIDSVYAIFATTANLPTISAREVKSIGLYVKSLLGLRGRCERVASMSVLLLVVTCGCSRCVAGGAHTLYMQRTVLSAAWSHFSIADGTGDYTTAAYSDLPLDGDPCFDRQGQLLVKLALVCSELMLYVRVRFEQRQVVRSMRVQSLSFAASKNHARVIVASVVR